MNSNFSHKDMSNKPDIRKANVCPPLPKQANAFDRFIYWLGIGLGSGLPKRAAGTWGTVGGLLVGIPLVKLGFLPFLLIIVIMSVAGYFICGHTSELMGVHDDPHIVFDEWVGMWIVLLPLSYWGIDFDWMTVVEVVLAFALFRLFDILKPFPISWADKKVSGGVGIMLDDILAGLMALVIMGLLMAMGIHQHLL